MVQLQRDLFCLEWSTCLNTRLYIWMSHIQMAELLSESSAPRFFTQQIQSQREQTKKAEPSTFSIVGLYLICTGTQKLTLLSTALNTQGDAGGGILLTPAFRTLRLQLLLCWEQGKSRLWSLLPVSREQWAWWAPSPSCAQPLLPSSFARSLIPLLWAWQLHI